MPTRKRRSSDNSSKERAPKKVAITETADAVAESKNERETKSGSTDLHNIYKLCILEEDKRLRLQNIQKWEEQGALEEIVWPFLTQNSDSKDHFHACNLLVVLLSHRFVEGTYSDATFFFDNIDQSDENIAIVQKLFHAILYKTEKTDFYLQTCIVHFLDIALCRSSSRDDAWLKIIISHVSGIDLWNWMPDRIRELELKKSAGL